MAKYRNTIEDTILQLKALSDQNRLRLFMVLQEQETCVCHLTQLLEIAPSTLSKHLSILKSAKLVTSRKERQWIYYKALPLFPELVSGLAHEKTIRQDHTHLKKIQKRGCS